MNFVAVAIASAIFLGLSTEESSFDWFKLHPPLFKQQWSAHQEVVL